MKRKILSLEHRAKISRSMKGGNQTSFKKGVVPWNKGKKWSNDTKEKMRQAKLKNPTRYWLNKCRPDMAGENNPNWKRFGQNHPKWVEEKKRPFYKSIRQLFKYIEWRKEIFKRDNFTCQICGAEKVYIEADHYPKRFVDIIKVNTINTTDDALNCAELWDVNNGRTICKPCHIKTITWGKKKD